jgi:uncharacterized protein YndB with AHSA1/START domain
MYGRLDRAEGRSRLWYRRNLPHPPEKVWRALTEPEHLDAWFPTTIDGERAEGAELRFRFRDGEATDMCGRMLAYEPPSLLEFTWGDDRVRFELRPDAEGCLLTMTVALDEHGKAARDGAGWHVCLNALEADLSGAVDARTALDGWTTVQGWYIEHFGPEASTIGPPETAARGSG